MTAITPLEEMLYGSFLGPTFSEQGSEVYTKYEKMKDPIEIGVQIATYKFMANARKAVRYFDSFSKGIYLTIPPLVMFNQIPEEGFFTSPAFLISSAMLMFVYSHYKQKYNQKVEDECRQRISILEKRSEELNI